MIDPIFNMFKTKFVVMDELNLLRKDVDRVDIYINLESVMKVIMSPRINNFLMTTVDKNLFKINMMSNIVNLAQHYRLYCRKHKKDSRIFLFWNYPKSDYKNSEYIAGFREYYNHKMFRNEGCEYIYRNFTECLNFMNKLFSYVNQVYLINGDSIDSSVVPYLVEDKIYHSRDDDSIQKIIVSNSKYDFQYVNYGFTVLETNKDSSLVITQDNVIDILKSKMNVRNVELSSPHTLLPFIISLLGDKYRSIPKLSGVGLSSILKMVTKALDGLLITESTQDIEMLSNIIAETYRGQFIKNYLSTYIPRQSDEVTPLELHNIELQIMDKFDDNALEYINEKYFKPCPLMIIGNKTEQVVENIQKSIWDR